MSTDPTLIFYDGHCGLCHRAVKLALRQDPDGNRFRFAPLEGSTLRRRLTPDAIDQLSDSLVVLPSDGPLLQQSDAVLRILDEIGGGWRILGRICARVPRSLRDLVYRFVARVRYRLFKRHDESCPVVSPAFHDRFLP